MLLDFCIFFPLSSVLKYERKPEIINKRAQIEKYKKIIQSKKIWMIKKY